MDESKITDDVIQELIGILEGHMAGGLQKPGMDEHPALEQPLPEGDPAEEAAESPEMEASEMPGDESPEDKNKRMLMEKFGRR